MASQTAAHATGPTGKPKNCSTWAEYEEKGSSTTAALCHGGYFDNDYYDTCPSKNDCQLATIRKKHEPRLSSPPILNPARNSSTVLGQTPNVAQRVTPQPQYYPYPQPSLHPQKVPPAYSGLPTSIPARPASHPTSGYPHYQPVMPPADYPVAMQTPYGAPMHVGAEGAASPTFLPQSSEGTFSRLGKNVAQGMMSAAGWHVFSYMRYVDIFK